MFPFTDLPALPVPGGSHVRICDLIVFLPSKLTKETRSSVARLFGLAAERGARSLILIGTARVLYGDFDATEVERFACACASSHGRRPVVFRTSPILSSQSRALRWLRLSEATDRPLIVIGNRPADLAGQGLEDFLAMPEPIRELDIVSRQSSQHLYYRIARRLVASAVAERPDRSPPY